MRSEMSLGERLQNLLQLWELSTFSKSVPIFELEEPNVVMAPRLPNISMAIMGISGENSNKTQALYATFLKKKEKQLLSLIVVVAVL